MTGAFEESLPLVMYLLQQGHPSDSFPNSSTNRGRSIQIYEPRGAVVIQCTVPYLPGQLDDVWLVSLFWCWEFNRVGLCTCSACTLLPSSILVPDSLRTAPLTRLLGQDSRVSGLQRRQRCVLDWTGECLASRQDWEVVWDLLDGMLSEYRVS